GYYIFSDEKVEEKIEKTMIISLVISILSAILYMVKFNFSDYTSSICLQDVITNIYAYFTSIFLIGLFKKYFDKSNKVLKYLSSSSFGLYVLHYTPILLTGLIVSGTSLNVYLRYLLTLILGFILTVLLYEVIKRIPIYRYFVLGIK
ncbi:MAG: hypothetical protein PUH25_09325, partial [Spirochaetales bacterium]|nr:hypothetical protein [Spirochaetales bacterium]